MSCSVKVFKIFYSLLGEYYGKFSLVKVRAYPVPQSAAQSATPEPERESARSGGFCRLSPEASERLELVALGVVPHLTQTAVRMARSVKASSTCQFRLGWCGQIRWPMG
jgi:hypothetical protein